MEMVPNEHYQDDIMYITQITRNVLNLLGVWPSFVKEKSIGERFRKLVLISTNWILLYCVLVPGTFFMMLEKRSRVRIQTIPLLLYGYMAIGKYVNLLFREEQIKRCLRHIEEDWKNVVSTDYRNKMLESAKIGRRLAALCGAFMYGSGVSFRSILPLSKGKIVTAQNVTLRPLPCPGYFFSLDVQVSPTYEMVFAMQFFSGLVTFSITTAVCGLTAVCVMHACGQLRILINLMRHLVEEQWQGIHEVDKKLAAVVEHQIRVRSFLQMVEQTVQQICLIEVVGCTLCVCIGCYCLLMEWERSNPIAMCSYFISLTSMMINVFMFCYTGEQLTAQAEKVASTSCELEWYRLPDKKARGIVLVMIMSNAPTKITAGKIINLSLKTFGDVVKTSVTYFNLLRNVM